jgi:hypothetical protein
LLLLPLLLPLRMRQQARRLRRLRQQVLRQMLEVLWQRLVAGRLRGVQQMDEGKQQRGGMDMERSSGGHSGVEGGDGAVTDDSSLLEPWFEDP